MSLTWAFGDIQDDWNVVLDRYWTIHKYSGGYTRYIRLAETLDLPALKASLNHCIGDFSYAIAESSSLDPRLDVGKILYLKDDAIWMVGNETAKREILPPPPARIYEI